MLMLLGFIRIATWNFPLLSFLLHCVNNPHFVHLFIAWMLWIFLSTSWLF